MINNISSNFSVNSPMTESSVKRPEGFQGSSSDCFVHDDTREADDKQFADMQKLCQAHKKHGKHGGPNGTHGPSGPNKGGKVNGDPVGMFPNRDGYDTSFLGKELPMPQLGAEIADKASHLIGQPDEIELKYTNFSVVMNAERKQCFYTICNIDGNQATEPPRNGTWTIDGRIPREHQLGNEAYSNNTIDRGHMVRRLDPCWGSKAQQANEDTFVYTNSTMQCEGLNQVEWLELENHVLESSKGQKMTVITGPVFSDDDPKFNNHGRVKGGDVQIPQQFWKVVVWNDEKSGELKGAAFVLSQKDILERSSDLFKGGFNPGRFETYQVPIKNLESMTHLKFGEQIGDITTDAVRLTAANGYKPEGL